MYLKMKELKGKLVLSFSSSHSSCQHSGYVTETAQGKRRIGGKKVHVALCMDVCKIKRLAFPKQTGGLGETRVAITDTSERLSFFVVFP